MYKYLKEHSYISKNKKSNYQFELSKERAECIANKHNNLLNDLQQQCKKQKEVIDKSIELLGNYKHYSTPDEKQNSDNEDLVNNAFDILKEMINNE